MQKTYQKQNNLFFPLQIFIEAFDKNSKTTLDFEYKNVTINEDFTFPYSVPDGYNQIFVE
jgi:outer membrane lipoprotein-sorting protein